jgi:hypothetical protein
VAKATALEMTDSGLNKGQCFTYQQGYECRGVWTDSGEVRRPETQAGQRSESASRVSAGVSCGGHKCSMDRIGSEQAGTSKVEDGGGWRGSRFLYGRGR